MSHALPRVALLLAAALGLAPVRAAAESPLSGSFELRAGSFRPDIDSRFTGPRFPYEIAFGSSRPYGFKAHLARALPWRTWGTVEVGLGAGWWEANGHAVDANDQPTAERTALRIIPAELTLTYRADVLWRVYRVPLVPYGRVSLQRYHWRVTGAGGVTVKDGATNGYGWGGGVGLVLDFIDSTLAREFDADAGVNHTMLVFDVAKARVDDFGSDQSWNLSDSQLTMSVGLLFVF